MLRLPLRSCHAYAHVKASSPPAKRAASEPVSKNPRAYAFNMFTTNAFNNCFQIACTMLVTLVPLDWFACLLFVFFSERFPFICRAGLCWTPFLCTGTVFGEGQVRGAQLKHPVAPQNAEKHNVFGQFFLQMASSLSNFICKSLIFRFWQSAGLETEL